MTRQQRRPLVRLLTNTQAATELGVSVPALDRLVQAGAINAVQVSARRGRRFWPRDIAAWRRTSGAGTAAASARDDVATGAASPAAGSRPVPSAATRRPHWLPFAVATKRIQPTYLGFADAATLTRFLRLRASPTG